MIKDENNIYTYALFSDDMKERYLLHKSWNKELKKAAIIMINPASNSIFNIDLTCQLIQTNLNKLGYGSFDVLNICSKINPTNSEIATFNSEENKKQIVESCKKADDIIVCYGTVGEGNKKISSKINKILKLLEPFQNKIKTTEDEQGNKNRHPLCPNLRSRWKLVEFVLPTANTEKGAESEKKKPKAVPKDSENKYKQEPKKETI